LDLCFLLGYIAPVKRKRYNVSLSPEIVEAAQQAAKLANKSFSRMVEDMLIEITGAAKTAADKRKNNK
jgi:hypothetical protein